MYENSDLPLCEFIDTSWWEIMAEVLEKDVPPTEEQINRVVILGLFSMEWKNTRLQTKWTRKSGNRMLNQAELLVTQLGTQLDWNHTHYTCYSAF